MWDGVAWPPVDVWGRPGIPESGFHVVHVSSGLGREEGRAGGRTLLQLVRTAGERTQAAFWPGECLWSCLDIRSSRRKHTEWVLRQCPAPRDLDSLRTLAPAHSPHTRDPGHLFAPLPHSHTKLCSGFPLCSNAGLRNLTSSKRSNSNITSFRNPADHCRHVVPAEYQARG